MKKRFLPVAAAGLWITLSEFVRNEFLFRQYWVDHFASLGLTFATLPVNGMLWMIWSVMLAFLIFRLLDRFSFGETLLLSWVAAFAMMWITVFNLQVLPVGLLLAAIPLSLLEVTLAALIIKRMR